MPKDTEETEDITNVFHVASADDLSYEYWAVETEDGMWLMLTIAPQEGEPLRIAFKNGHSQLFKFMSNMLTSFGDAL